MATEYVKSKQRLKGVRTMLMATAVINAVVMLVMGIISSFMETGVPVYLQNLITGITAYIIPIEIYAHTTGVTAETAAERFCLKRCGGGIIGLAAAMGVCWQFVMVVINLPLNIVFKTSVSYMPNSPVEFGAAVIVLGVLPAVFEEVMFRGIIDGSLSEVNTRAAAIFSAVMFAVLHADIVYFPGYVVMGAFLTCVVRRSGSLYAAMLFHLANNVTALLLGYFNSELFYSPAVTIFVFAAGCVGFALLFVFFGAVTKKPATVKLINTSQLLAQSFVSLPILLCIAATAAAAVVVRFI